MGALKAKGVQNQARRRKRGMGMKYYCEFESDYPQHGHQEFFADSDEQAIEVAKILSHGLKVLTVYHLDNNNEIVEV